VLNVREPAKRAADVNLLIDKTKSSSTLNTIRGGVTNHLCGFLLCAQ
jgi:hypothetical protein